MKHLKKYNESSQEFTFTDIVDILQDIIDEGHDVFIYSANGFSWRPEDIDKNHSAFKFKRYPNARSEFKIQISFKKSLEYNDLIDFFDEMRVPIVRFEDNGFQLSNMYTESNEDSDRYSCYIVDYHFFSNL